MQAGCDVAGTSRRLPPWNLSLELVVISGDSISTVEYYDLNLGKWRVGEPMNTLRSRVGIAVLAGNGGTRPLYSGHLSTIHAIWGESTAVNVCNTCIALCS